MNPTMWKSTQRFVSPSNLAITTLVGFLCLGYVTDWNMLRSRPSRSASAVTPRLPNQVSQGLPARLRYTRLESGRSRSIGVDARSEFADRRAVNHDAKNHSELD
jgi:hypothetical protein